VQLKVSDRAERKENELVQIMFGKGKKLRNAAARNRGRDDGDDGGGDDAEVIDEEGADDGATGVGGIDGEAVGADGFEGRLPLLTSMAKNEDPLAWKLTRPLVASRPGGYQQIRIYPGILSGPIPIRLLPVTPMPMLPLPVLKKPMLLLPKLNQPWL
jgi:hypothetical protein